MAIFKVGADTVVESSDPLLDVIVTPESALTVGKHVFQLVVTDNAGNQSAPAFVTIIVQDKSAPTAVIDFVDANGVRNPLPEVTLAFGDAFTLSAERSSDIGGTVSGYTWTLVQA